MILFDMYKKTFQFEELFNSRKLEQIIPPSTTNIKIYCTPLHITCCLRK